METTLFPATRRACDSHVHILGDPRVYPYTSGALRFVPKVVLPEDYLPLREAMGLERVVLVQPSIYGHDNSCQLDAAACFGLENARVVVSVDEYTVTDRELQELHLRGARGIRVNVLSTQAYSPGIAENILSALQKLEQLIINTPWFIDIICPDWLILELRRDLEKLKVPYCLAHFGMNKACHGVASRSFQAMLSLMREGNCWVKLSAPYRISGLPDYADAVELGRAIYETAPGRVLWGSDFPHVNTEGVDTFSTYELLKQIVPDGADLRRVLSDNPAALFGFGEQ